MKQTLILGTLLFATSTLLVGTTMSTTGCTTLGCTEVGCGTTLDVKLDKMVNASTKLPLAIKVCIDDGSCSDLTVEDTGGVVPACTSDTVLCSVDSGGTVSMQQGFVKDFDDSTEDHDIHVTVRDAQSTVIFDQTKSTKLAFNYPNGEDCDPDPCIQGDITFTP